VAIAASGVIVVYLAIAFVVFLGAVTPEMCGRTIAAPQIPGFGWQPPAAKRLLNAEIVMGRIDAALGASDPATRLAEISIGRRRLDASLDLERFSSQLDECYELYDRLTEGGQDPGASAESLADLTKLETIVDGLLAPVPAGEAQWHAIETSLGTDRQGRSILLRAVFSIKVAVQIGLVTACVSTLIGSVLGAAAGYFGGWIDHLVIWLYSVFSSIPNLVFLIVLAYAFGNLQILVFGKPIDQTLIPVYVAFCATFWIGPCRVIRGETIKIRELEYVQAAVSAGFSAPYVLLRHVLPNTVHLMLINFSLLLIGAIKSEVILSFLGLGVQPGAGASWGIMIRDSGKEVMQEFFWQMGAASVLMFVFVLAFNLLSDALQDAFDPKHV